MSCQITTEESLERMEALIQRWIDACEGETLEIVNFAAFRWATFRMHEMMKLAEPDEFITKLHKSLTVLLNACATHLREDHPSRHSKH